MWAGLIHMTRLKTSQLSQPEIVNAGVGGEAAHSRFVSVPVDEEGVFDSEEEAAARVAVLNERFPRRFFEVFPVEDSDEEDVLY